MVSMVDPRQSRSTAEETEVRVPLGGEFFRGNSLFFVSEGEKSPNGMPLRREREGMPLSPGEGKGRECPFRLERARRRPDPPGELLSGRSHLK